MVAGLVSSASNASRRMRSKPKPGSSGSASASSFSFSNRNITFASCSGAPVLTAMRATLPSARKNTVSNCRAPRPSRSRISHKDPARLCRAAAMTSRETTGSAKCCSAIRSGRARNGVIGCSSQPSITSRRVTKDLPSRSANSLRSRLATWPTVFNPARSRALAIFSSQSKAAMGSGATAAASPPTGTMLHGAWRASALV